MDELDEWRLVNVFLPALLPIGIMLTVWAMSQGKEASKRSSPWAAVKDGQLFWVALGYACAGIFELHYPASCATIKKSLLVGKEWEDIGAIVLSAILAAIAPLEVTEGQASGNWLARAKHFRVFLSSLVVVAGCALLYNDIHLTTQTEPCKVMGGSGVKP